MKQPTWLSALFGSTSRHSSAFSRDSLDVSLEVECLEERRVLAPLIQNLDLDNPSYNVGSTAVILDQSTNAFVSGEDSTYNGDTLTITNTSATPFGQLSIAAAPGGEYNAPPVGPGAPLVITFTASADSDAVNAALRAVKFDILVPPTGPPAPQDQTITFVYSDGGTSSNTATVTVNVNNPPLLDLDGTGTPSVNNTASFTEGTPVVLAAAADLLDPDDTMMNGATVIITNTSDGTNEVLGFTPVTGISGTYNSSNHTLSFTGLASIANYQTILRSVTYNNLSENPTTTGDRTVTFRITDAAGATNLSPFAVSTVSVTALNDPPALDLNGAGAGTNNAVDFTEGLGAVSLANAATLTDVDNTSLHSVTVTITNPLDTTQESLSYSLGSTTGITAVLSNNNHTLTLTSTTPGSGSLADFLTILRSVQYNNLSQNPNTTARSVQFSVVDVMSATPVTATTTVSIITDNNPPVIDLNGAGTGINNAVDFTEDLGAVSLASVATLTDPDNTSLHSVTVTITNPLDTTDESLSFSTAGTTGITAVLSNNNHTLTLTNTTPGSGSVADFLTIIKSVKYNNLSQDPDTTARSVQFSVVDVMSATPVTATTTVTVIAVNDPPELDLNGADTGTDHAVDFTEDLGAVFLADVATLIDVDNTSLHSATVTISNPLDGVLESLSFSTAGTTGITAVLSNNDHTLTLTSTTPGSGSVADFLTILRSVQYNNLSQDPDTTDRSVVFSVVDVMGETPVTATTTVTVIAVNDLPELDLNGSGTGIDHVATFTEDLGAVSLVDSTATLIDVDDDNMDGATVTIVDVNLRNGTDEVLTFDLTGTTGITGSYDDTTGVLTFTGVASKADYLTVLKSVQYNNLSQDPDTTDREIEFQITDEFGEPSLVATTIVTVIAVNDPPELDLNGLVTTGLDHTAGFTEDGAAVALSGALASLIDVDDDNMDGATVTITNVLNGTDEVLTFDLTGTTGITGSYDDTTGVLTFTGVASKADYLTVLKTIRYNNLSQDPDTTTREIRFIVTDEYGDPSLVAKTMVTITAKNDLPVLDLDGSTLGVDFTTGFTEGTPAVLTNAATLIDVDDDNMSGATVVINNPTNGTDEVLLFDTTGTSVGASYDPNTHTLTLTGTRSKAEYLTVLSSVRYDNLNNDPDTTTRSITFTVTDEYGESSTAEVTLTVTPQNDPPIAVNDSFTVNEDSVANNLAVLNNDGVVEASDVLSISAVGTAANGTVSIAANNLSVIYTPNANFSGTDTFTYTLSDGNGGEATATVTVTVNPHNDRPVLAGDAELPIVTQGDTNPTGTQLSTLLNPLFTDIDTGDLLSVVAIVGNTADPVTQGHWEYSSNGTSWSTLNTGLSDSTAFVLLASYYVRFVPVASFSGDAPALTIRAGDTTWPVSQLSFRNLSTNLALGQESSFSAKQSIEVLVNDRPATLPDSATVVEGGSGTFNVTDNDSDSNGLDLTTLVIETAPTLGFTAIANTDGTITFTVDDPLNNFFGDVTFTYTIRDTLGTISLPTTVTVTVTDVNDDPTANDDPVTVFEDSTNNPINVLNNDSTAPDTGSPGEVLSIVSVQGFSAGGSATISGGVIYYTPLANFQGTETFTYTISDGRGGTATATVTVTVLDVNDPPNAMDVVFNAQEDGGPYTIDVLSSVTSDPDPAGETFTLIGVGTPSLGGSVSIVANQIQYSPGPDQFGVETFTYTVRDNRGGVATATVTVNIASVDDPPVLDLNGSGTIGVDFSVTFTEDNGAVFLSSSNATLTDPDDTMLSGATVSITNPFDGTDEVLLYTNPYPGTITATYSGHTLTLTGTATLSQYLDVLRSVRYNNLSNNPDTTSRSVVFTVTSPGGGVGTATTTVSVIEQNDIPDAVSGGPYVIDEGSNLLLDASGSTDPDDTLRYLWDLNGDGNFGDLLGLEDAALPGVFFDGTQATFTISWADLNSFGIVNGPSTRTIRLLVSDGRGGTDIDNALLTVNNVAPTVTIDLTANGNPVAVGGNVFEGDSLTLTATVDDPVDVGFNFTYSWVVLKDGVSFANYTTTTTNTTSSFSLFPSDDANYEVTLTVTDRDGGQVMENYSFTASNVNTVLSPIANPPAIDEGSQVSIDINFSDAGFGSSEVFTIVIDWGDGSGLQVISGIDFSPTNPLATDTAPNIPQTYTVQHTYADNPSGGNTFTARVGIRDDEMAMDPATTGTVEGDFASNNTDLFTYQNFTATVNNVPATFLVAPVASDIGNDQTTTITGTFFDPGADTHTVIVSYVDQAGITINTPATVTGNSFSVSIRFNGNPDPNNPLAPIPLTIIVFDDDTLIGGAARIEIEAIVISPLFTTIVTDLDIDIPSLQVQTVAVQSPLAPLNVAPIAREVQAQRASSAQVNTNETVVNLYRLEDGQEVWVLSTSDLDSMDLVLEKLPDGKYRVKIAEDGSELQVMEVYVRQGRLETIDDLEGWEDGSNIPSEVAEETPATQPEQTTPDRQAARPADPKSAALDPIPSDTFWEQLGDVSFPLDGVPNFDAPLLPDVTRVSMTETADPLVAVHEDFLWSLAAEQQAEENVEEEGMPYGAMLLGSFGAAGALTVGYVQHSRRRNALQVSPDEV